jgi:hypothetical protein
MTSIHISDVRAYRQCRRKWNWSSPLRENLESVVPYAPFFTGRAIHAALEFYYGDRQSFAETLDKYFDEERKNMEQLGELWPQEVALFHEQIDLIWQIMEHYSLWQSIDDKTYSDKNLEFIVMEKDFEVPMPTLSGGDSKALTLGGRLDGLVRHKETGEYWIWEAKTTRSVRELVNSLANDEQCGAYMYAASKLYKVPIKGVLYNIMRKKAPADPSILQDGSFSRSRNADTTSFHYVRKIREMYPDWSDETILEMYGDVLASLQENESKFFMRYPVYRSDYEIKQLMRNLYLTAREMVAKKTAIYPAPSWLNCNFCSFRAPCLAMNAGGGGHEILLAEEFQVRTSATSMRDKTTDEGETNG